MPRAKCVTFNSYSYKNSMICTDFAEEEPEVCGRVTTWPSHIVSESQDLKQSDSRVNVLN